MSKQLQHKLFEKLPTSTVSQSRLKIYQPTRYPKAEKREIETAWGTAVITGKLGQMHAGFIESVSKNAMKIRHLDDGRVQILVDPYKVRLSMNGGKQYSGQRADAIADDVLQVLIELRTKDFKVIGHVFDEIEESLAVPNPLKNNGKTKERFLWRVTVARAYVHLIGEDLHLTYDPEPIARLTKGVSQAVARHVATHTKEPNGGWIIDRLIEAVGAGDTTRAMYDRKRDLLADAAGLAELGLIIENGRLTRSKTDKKLSA